MLIDFNQPDAAAPAHAAVCVIGAGAAGIALAVTLARSGHTVTLLEGGGREQEARSQDIYRGLLAGKPHRGIHEGRFRTYGGTTTRWGGQILELQEIDFQERPWVPGSGWPFPKRELTEAYQRSLRYVGLARVEQDDDAVWRSLGLNETETEFARDTLGPEFAMMYSRWLPERNVATLHARTLESSRRIRVYTHASVVRFNMTNAGDAVESVQVRSFSGREAAASAERFVLCTGGIESVRLLLQPPSEGTLPWQRNGRLGRHFQDHIGVNNLPIRVRGVRDPMRVFGYNVANGFRYHNKIWLTPEQQRRAGTLNVAGTIGPDMPERPARDAAMNWLRDTLRSRRRPRAGEALRRAPHVAAIAGSRLRDRFQGEARHWNKLMLTVHAEQSPLSGSSIRLSDERDELGLLRTSLDWQISAQELHTVRQFVKVATEVFRARGLADVSVPARFFEDDALLRGMCGDSYHHMGGARMSRSAGDGVVDPDLRLHGTRNAFVCSASVFPTSGYSNPTHTVLALAMRLADRLEAELAPRAPANVTNTVGPMREIALPGSGRVTSQLGFGCAYLLGPGLDAAKSRRLLDTAWDAGIRHFDAARLYGMGRTEALLGEFLAAHPEATVTSKFGVVPPTSLERMRMAAGRVAPPLRRLARRNDKAVFRARDAQAALETTLRALRRERVDLYLLHEATAADLVHDDLLAWLRRKREEGVIGEFGVGGEYANIPRILTERPEYAPVLQFERSLLGPEVDCGRAAAIFYRTFAPAAKAVTALLDREPETLRAWSDAVGLDLAEPETVSRLLLRAALDRWPETLQLFSTSSEQRVEENAAVAGDTSLEAPAERLATLVRSRGELGTALYRGQ